MSKVPVTIISAEPEKLGSYIKRVIRHYSLIGTLARRDLKTKYAQTFIGLGWSVLQPLAALVVFTLFFDLVLDIDTDVPYILFVFPGIVGWGFFNYIFIQGSTSLLQASDLIRKIQFPKIVLPFSKVLVGSVELVVGILLLVPIMVWAKVLPGWQVIFLPFVILCIALLGTGMALFLSAGTVRYRDLHHIVPFLVNFGIWLTPVFYPVSLLPEQYENYLYINPMAGLLELFRWTLGYADYSHLYLIGVGLSIVVFLGGFLYFKSVEDRIVESL